jgi:hypothetical protein
MAGVWLAAQFSASALAQEGSPSPDQKWSAYLEAGPTVLLTELEGEIDDLLVEDNTSLHALSVRGGVDVSQYLSIEADLALGTSGENLNESASINGIGGSFAGEVELKYLTGLYLKGHVPLTKSERVEAFARVGYVVSEIQANGTVTAVLDEPPTITIFDVPFTIPGSYTKTGTYSAERSGPVVGGGVELDFSDKFYLRGEATYYGLENAPTVGLTATVGYRF